jgi:hypothetical protein
MELYKIIILLLATSIISVAVCIIIIYIGFRMGQKTVSLPVEKKAKEFDPGEPGKLEYDPYEVALGNQKESVEDVK